MPGVSQYYFYLTQLVAPIRMPLSDLSYDIQIPVIAALILGILGALSPCQLSTNIAAFAFTDDNVALPDAKSSSQRKSMRNASSLSACVSKGPRTACLTRR